MITQRNIIVTDEVFSPVTAVIEACSSETAIILSPQFTNYGIIRPRLLYFNGYDAGKQQSLYREVGSAPNLATEDWDVVSTGGANGGGFIRSKKRTDNLGQFVIIPAFSVSNGPAINWNQVDSLPAPFRPALGVPETQIASADMLIKLNLFGKTLTQPMNFAAFYSTFLFVRHPQIILRLLPDLTIQPCLVTSGPIYIPVGPPSILKVPTTGWFGINWASGISKIDNDVSGFVTAILHANEDDYRGSLLFDYQGVNTRSDELDTINAYGWGTEVLVNGGPGVDGIGFDDAHISGDYGTERKLFGLASVDKLVPIAMGDQNDSLISYDGRKVVASEPPTQVGNNNVWGDVDRVKNLLGGGMALDAYLDHARTYNYYTNVANQLRNLDQWIVGGTGAGTGAWVTFIWGAPPDFSGTDITVGPHQPPLDTVRRNMLYTGATGIGATELYKMSAPRTEALVINGIQILTITGNYDIVVRIAGIEDHFSTSSPRIAIIEDFNHIYDSILKIDGQIIKARTDYAEFVGISWAPQIGYKASPFSVITVDGNNNPLKLNNIQAGVKLRTDIVDQVIALIPGGGYTRYTKVDLVQVLTEYSYRKQQFTLTVPPPSKPIVKLILVNISGDGRTITVREASVSWNTKIVSRVIDWGDGSPTEAIAESERLDQGSSIVWPILNHHFSTGGTFNVTLTVTDDLGQTGTDKYIAIVPFSAPIASFTIDSAPGSTFINFTNDSTDLDDDIVSYDWNFSDGSSISHVLSPSHNYAAPGTYSVSLKATDAQGLTNTITTSIIVPIPIIVTGCGLSVNARTSPATASVQADDYAGGNARFINYLNSTNLQSYIWNKVPFRAFYRFALAHDASEYQLDTVETFNGRSSLKVSIHGDGYGAFTSRFTDDTTNLGDDEDFSNNLVNNIWIRIIFKLNQQLIDLANPISVAGRGFQLASIYGQSNYNPLIYANGGHVYQDIQTRLTLGASQTRREYVDLGAFPAIANKDWCELIAYAGSDEAAHTQRNMTWLGDACSLAGVSPLVDRSNTAFPSSALAVQGIKFDSVDWMFYFNEGSALFTDPKPAPNISLIEIHHGVPLASNPFGVGLT